MIESPGVIRKMGPYEKLYFGSDTANGRLKALQTIFKNASIESYLVDTSKKLFGRNLFSFLLSFATSYLNQNIGEIINSSRAIYVELLNEITMLAAIKD
jgi:2-dehydropantoate 2-reductase